MSQASQIALCQTASQGGKDASRLQLRTLPGLTVGDVVLGLPALAMWNVKVDPHSNSVEVHGTVVRCEHICKDALAFPVPSLLPFLAPRLRYEFLRN